MQNGWENQSKFNIKIKPMKVQYKNYIIEDDRNGYILSILWENKKEGSDNFWEMYIREQVYPSTFEKCIERIFSLQKMSNEWKKTFEEYIQAQREILKELKEWFSNIKI